MVLANDFGDSLATSLATSLAYEPVVPPPTAEIYGIKMEYVGEEMYMLGYASPGISKSPYNPETYTHYYSSSMFYEAFKLYANGEIGSATKAVLLDGTEFDFDEPVGDVMFSVVSSNELNRALTIKVDHEGSENSFYFIDLTTLEAGEFYSGASIREGVDFIVGPDQSTTQSRSLAVGDTVYLLDNIEGTYTPYGTVTELNVEISNEDINWITVSDVESKVTFYAKYSGKDHPYIWTDGDDNYYTNSRVPEIGDDVYSGSSSSTILGSVTSVEYDFVIHGLELEESEEDYFSNIVAFPGVSAIFDEDGNPVKQSVMVHVDGTYGNGNPFVVNSVMQWNSEYHEFDGPNPIPSSTQPSQIYYGLGNVYFTLLKG